MQIKPGRKAVFLAVFCVLTGLAFVNAKTAEADSISLAVPIPYIESVPLASMRPQPNIKFEIDLAASVAGGTTGTFSATGCPSGAACQFLDSGGNPLGSTPDIGAIPATGVYFYAITTGDSTALGLANITFTLTPANCGGTCPQIGKALAQAKVLSKYSAGFSDGGGLVYALNNGPAPAPRLIPISNWGTGTLNWTATVDQSWCHLSAASGSVAGYAMGYTSLSFDSPSAAGLAAGGPYTCTVTLADTGGFSWLYPFLGREKTFYYVEDAANFKVTFSQSQCDAITVNWNSFPGAAGYNVYRQLAYRGAYNAAYATQVATNLQTNTFADTNINLFNPGTNYQYSDDSSPDYSYWVEPIGTADGKVQALLSPSAGTYTLALRCGGPMIYPSGSGGNGGKGGGVNGSGSAVGSGSGFGYLQNMGSEPMNATYSSSDPGCAFYTNGVNQPSWTVAPGGVVLYNYLSSFGFNSLGNAQCSYTVTATNQAAGTNYYSATQSLDYNAGSPGLITADISNCGQIIINWAAADYADGYKIIRLEHNQADQSDMMVNHSFDGGGPNAVTVATIPASPFPASGTYSFDDTTAVPGVAYDYGIMVTNGYVNYTGYLSFAVFSADYPSGSGTTAAACQAPAAVCPAGSVQLASSSIGVNDTTTATATPAIGWTGGSFSSDNISVATVSGASGSTITGQSPGPANISGSGWAVPLTKQAYDNIAISNNGQYQTVVARGGNLYVSSDYGNTWVPKDSAQAWYAVGMSSSGQYQTAAVSGLGTGYIYISNDYGQTWTPKDSLRKWIAVAVSDSGQYQAAAEYNGFMYVSSDYGNTWAQKDSSRKWSSVAMSSTGQYETAGVMVSGNLYVSSDYGQTWSPKGINTNWDEKDIAVSDSGQFQTAAVYGGLIYISNDYGQTWAPVGSTNDWYGLAMSGNGQFQIAGSEAQNTYVSYDYGNTWTVKYTIPNSRSSGAVGMSSTGQYQTATGFNDYIYTSYDYGRTWSVPSGASNCSLNPAALTVSGSPAGPDSVTLDNASTCGQMVVNWTGVAGATSYNVYRNTSGNPPGAGDLLQSNINSTTYTDTAPPSSADTPYYYFVTAVGGAGESLATGGASNPSSINACVGNLADSDIDIVAVNGSQLYTKPSLPNGSQCDSGTDPLPANVSLKIGDVLKFSLNLCNDQGNGPIGMNKVASPFINLIMPSSASDFTASYNSTPLVYDGAQASNYSPAAGHYFVYGSVPNQTIVFNLTGNTINQGAVAAVTYSAQLSVPNGFVGSLSRFQNSFNPSYDEGAGPVRFTPLIPFIVAPNNSPQIKESN